jgi:hypothetical protein
MRRRKKNAPGPLHALLRGFRALGIDRCKHGFLCVVALLAISVKEIHRKNDFQS